MLQDLVAERLSSSCWAHVDFDEDGHALLAYPATHLDATCPLCAQAGLGDAGLGYPSLHKDE
jgi:hypothetical protein